MRKRIVIILFLFISLFLTGCDPTNNGGANKKEEYLVEFYDGETLLRVEEVLDGEFATAPTNLEKEGYDFVGWDNEFDIVRSDMKVHAIYEIKKFTVKFYVDGLLVSDQQVNYNESAVAPTNLDKDGYDITSWDVDFTNVKQNLDVRANYKIKTYTVNFYLGDLLISTQEVDYNQPATAPEVPIVEGYIFLGWDQEFENVKSDLNVTGYYLQIPEYNVLFIDGVTGNIIASGTVKYGGNLPYPEVDEYKQGYRFIGWSGEATNVMSNLEIIANYEKVNETYTITTSENIGLNVAKTNVPYNTFVQATVNIPEGKTILSFKVNGVETPLNTITMYLFYIQENTDLQVTIGDVSRIQVFYLNDLHGAILETSDDNPRYHEIGLAKIANFINEKRLSNPNSIFIAGGDMLQGSALSNHYKGESTLRLLEMMGLDVFIIGNHEFDWGIEEVTKHFAGTNPKYDFPLLAANIYKKGTNNLLEGTQPYHIIEKGPFKIGIIGYIGEGIESSIATSRVKDYEFRNPVPSISYYAQYLRESHGVNFVITVGHTGIGSANEEIRNLTGVNKVDLMFNAHSHSSYVDLSTGKAPIIQSRHNGIEVGYAEINNINGVIAVNESTIRNYNYDSSVDFNYQDPTIQAQIDVYTAETDPIFKETLIINNTNISRSDFGRWLSKLITVKTGSDAATYNSGGVRDDIPYGAITMEVLYKILPFDNMLKSAILKGNYASSQISSGPSYIKDGITIKDNNYYRVASNDYVFDKEYSYFMIYGTDHIIYDGFIRDWVIDELRLQAQAGLTFDVNNPIMSSQIILRGDWYETGAFI